MDDFFTKSKSKDSTDIDKSWHITEESKRFIQEKDYPFFVGSCGYAECAPGYNVNRTSPSSFSIEYVIEGKGFVKENDAVCYPEAGDAYVLHSKSKAIQRTDPSAPWKKMWVGISGTCAEKLFDVYNLNTQICFKNLNILDELKEILEICKSETLPREEIMSSCSVVFMKIVQKLYLYRLEDKTNIDNLGTAEKLKSLIDNLATSTNYTSLNDYAQKVYCSRNHAIHLFKERYGITPYKYIQEIRLKSAKKMLENSNLTIAEVAQSMNFCDSKYFSNWFKNQTGQSPRDYRSSLKNNKE